jgi:hypothetical protein
MKLYEIAQQYQIAFDKMSEDEELTQEIIEDSLVDIKDDFNDKAINVSYAIKNMEAETIAIREAEKNMAKRRQAIEKKIENVKSYLLNNMERCGITKIKCPYFVIRVKNCPPSVKILAETYIPKEFMRIKEEPDKTKLKDYLKDHEVTYAILETNKKRLEIK